MRPRLRQHLPSDGLPRIQRPAAATPSPSLWVGGSGGTRGSLPGLPSPCVSPASSRLAPAPPGQWVDKPFSRPWHIPSAHAHWTKGAQGLGCPERRVPGQLSACALCLSVSPFSQSLQENDPMVWTQCPWVRMTPGRPAQQGSEARGADMGSLLRPLLMVRGLLHSCPRRRALPLCQARPSGTERSRPCPRPPAAKCPGVSRTSVSWLSAWIPEFLESLRRLPPEPTPHPPWPFPGPALNCSPEDPHWSSWPGSASHPGLWLWRPRAGLCNCPESL